MRWILAGCCQLLLVSLSVSLMVSQKPRFYGLKTNHNIFIYCLSNEVQNTTVQWFKANEYNEPEEKRQEIKERGRISTKFGTHNMMKNSIFLLHELKTEDSGVYFCKINTVWGPGTEIQVVSHINLPQAQYRSKMKDGLIVLQGLLLAGCVAAILLRKQKLLSEKTDLEYEEPETDHIYEGLAIETCGGGLYEDLTAYCQPEGAEAPWE